LHQGADVTGTVANVNGHILLEAAHVGGGIRTVSGDIDIGGNSHVEGGILVKKQRTQIFWFFQWNSSDTPRIVIGPGAVVQGDLRFERKVLLYVSDRATIGPVIGATAVKFSGETPPG
jgi:cytoskeletal protein CcmA (bactofilin family)